MVRSRRDERDALVARVRLVTCEIELMLVQRDGQRLITQFGGAVDQIPVL